MIYATCFGLFTQNKETCKNLQNVSKVGSFHRIYKNVTNKHLVDDALDSMKRTQLIDVILDEFSSGNEQIQFMQENLC